MADSYLFVVGWLFFAAWSAIVFIVNLAAFGQELFPSVARSDHAQAPTQARSNQNKRADPDLPIRS